MSVNVMAMDYGSAVDNGGQKGLDAEDATQAVETQIQQACLTSAVGITVMIGQNDTPRRVCRGDFRAASSTRAISAWNHNPRTSS
jgi:hypothetical protein